MWVVEKTRHIRAEIFGEGVSDLVEIVRREIPTIQTFGNLEEDELEDVTESECYKKTKAMMTDGDRLKIRRENASISQKTLAEKTGFSVKKISAMENGRHPIDTKTARIFAKAIGCKVSQILDGA